MKRVFASALVALTTTTLTFAGGVTTAGADAAGSCVEPVPERAYTHDQLVYRLAVDLTDCDWWDGSPIELVASLDRVDAAGGHGAGSLALCATRLLAADDERHPSPPDEADATAPSGPAADQSESGWRRGACAVEVSVDHPPADVAHYKGAVTFPWQDGRRTVAFNAVCEPATGCVDLPVDPTTLLTPAADLYDDIGGDSHAG